VLGLRTRLSWFFFSLELKKVNVLLLALKRDGGSVQILIDEPVDHSNAGLM